MTLPAPATEAAPTPLRRRSRRSCELLAWTACCGHRHRRPSAWGRGCRA